MTMPALARFAITAQLLHDARGYPVAYIDATALAVFAYQGTAGTCVIDIHTRDDSAPRRLRVLVDGRPLPSVPTWTRAALRAAITTAFRNAEASDSAGHSRPPATPRTEQTP